MGKLLRGLMTAALLLTLVTPASAAWPQQFSDVDTWPDWALHGERINADIYVAHGGELAEAVWWELMVGDPPADGRPSSLRTFRPNDTITRAEYATILARALGIEAQQVAGAPWYRPNVDALKSHAIITAEGDFLVPITRREMGDWVGRAIEWYGVDLAGKPEASFSDIGGLAEAKYIKLASRAGVIKGYPDGTYGPAKTATRTEAAVMALRVAKQLKKEPPTAQFFEQQYIESWGVTTQIDKELLGRHGYNHSARFEPYVSPMGLYGPDGLNSELGFMFDFKTYDTYRELVSVKAEPILMRDTIALVKTMQTKRRVQLDSTVTFTWETTSYQYYGKRNGTWLFMNGMQTEEYGDWLPQPEVVR